MMARAVLIHGFQGEPMRGFRPWLKAELERKGWEVAVPAMPSPGAPRAEEWVAAIAKEVGKGKSGDCVLVGHSLGCIAILRYLEQAKGEVAGAVLVAGFMEGLGKDFSILENFLSPPPDFARVRGNCKKFVAIFSDNDPYVPLSQERLFREKLGAKTLVLHSRGHFSSSDGTVRLPEALRALLEMGE